MECKYTLIFSSSVYQLVMNIVAPKHLQAWLNVEARNHAVIRGIEVMELDNLKVKQKMNN